MDPVAFIHRFSFQDMPDAALARLKLSLLDLLGIACGGRGTALSRIVRDHAAEDLPGRCAMLLDDRRASVSGAALAAGMTIWSAPHRADSDPCRYLRHHSQS